MMSYCCFAFSSIRASTFVKRVLLSLFVVDKVARSVCVMLSCDCFVIFLNDFLLFIRQSFNIVFGLLD